ncbi:lysophospholipid acyltransferase family protein [Flavobacterium sp.]|uniref:lysophospholipid acyltransferase family protein n=1 Tax=Flavobacterium sp. TaxID=239 RepID=UPI00286E08F6|nr:lysophospholipid acyltransferase family protein [Flavobacterium sp.]
MQFLIYLIIYPILWIISILPFRVLYVFSDFVYFMTYHIIRYRKKTVRENLKLALPNLSEKEHLVIEKKFYSHMCDMFLEMIKTMSISEEEMDKRFEFTNLGLFKELESQQKSISIMCGHYASYEWVLSLNKYINFEGFAIYKRLANPYFDKLVRDIRSKFKATLITTKETIPTIESNYKIGKLGAFGFASDQSPKVFPSTYWSKFMGIETPIHTGAESLAKKFDMNIIFLRTKKIKRGYYQASFELLAEDPKNVPDFEITETFLRLLEKQIYEQPEYYLWTHKRWKHKK